MRVVSNHIWLFLAVFVNSIIVLVLTLPGPAIRSIILMFLGSTTIETQYRLDITIHLILFLTLGLVWLLYYIKSTQLGKWAIVKRLLIIGVATATFTELAQHFIPQRSMELFDWIADMLAILLIIGITSILNIQETR